MPPVYQQPTVGPQSVGRCWTQVAPVVRNISADTSARLKYPENGTYGRCERRTWLFTLERRHEHFVCADAHAARVLVY